MLKETQTLEKESGMTQSPMDSHPILSKLAGLTAEHLRTQLGSRLVVLPAQGPGLPCSSPK